MIRISDLLAFHQEFHSNLQMDRFITAAAGGTPWGMFKQALRELATRYEALKTDLQRLSHLTGTHLDPAHAQMQRDTLCRTIRDREREFVRFYAQACALKEMLGPINPDRIDQLDMEMWTHRARWEAAADLASGQPISRRTIDLIQALPEEVRAPVWVQIRHDPGGLIDWFVSFEPPMPDLMPFLPKPEDVRALLC